VRNGSREIIPFQRFICSLRLVCDLNPGAPAEVGPAGILLVRLPA